MKKGTIHSWLAYLMGIGSTVSVGFIKVLIKAYPHEVVIGAIVTMTLGYIGKRAWQKHKSYRMNMNTECE
jgi:hypothetical protein